jgi:hypothetical protein
LVAPFFFLSFPSSYKLSPTNNFLKCTSKVPEFLFVYFGRKWLRMKVKENREILSPLGCQPGKMPNVRGLTENYPATCWKDWPPQHNPAGTTA